jgi:hypothetical protein
VGSLTTTGTVKFNPDKTYAFATTSQGSVSVTLPASCLVINGLTATCAQVQQGLLALPGSPFSAASCTGSNGCTCNLTVAAQPNNETGTWANAGNTDLALTPNAGGTNSGGPYCVKGNEIHLLTVDMTMTMGAMGSVKITEDIVGIKQ